MLLHHSASLLLFMQSTFHSPGPQSMVKCHTIPRLLSNFNWVGELTSQTVRKLNTRGNSQWGRNGLPSCLQRNTTYSFHRLDGVITISKALPQCVCDVQIRKGGIEHLPKSLRLHIQDRPLNSRPTQEWRRKLLFGRVEMLSIRGALMKDEDFVKKKNREKGLFNKWRKQ